MHAVFRELNGKTLSLTWSKKNSLIGPEALHQDPRPKTHAQAQAHAHAHVHAEPRWPDGGGGARVGSLLLSEAG